MAKDDGTNVRSAAIIAVIEELHSLRASAPSVIRSSAVEAAGRRGVYDLQAAEIRFIEDAVTTSINRAIWRYIRNQSSLIIGGLRTLAHLSDAHAQPDWMDYPPEIGHVPKGSVNVTSIGVNLDASQLAGGRTTIARVLADVTSDEPEDSEEVRPVTCWVSLRDGVVSVHIGPNTVATLSGDEAKRSAEAIVRWGGRFAQLEADGDLHGSSTSNVRLRLALYVVSHA